MASSNDSANPALQCNNRALREAGRNLGQLYDQHLAPTGLRATQFGLLARLKRLGPVSINALAAEMGLDRTTLGRNVLPLERDGLVAVTADDADRRAKRVALTPLGQQRLTQARTHWAKAQAAFEKAYGAERAAALRAMLKDVSELRWD